jgi:ubiquitin C-terminal hydrolase
MEILHNEISYKLDIWDIKNNQPANASEKRKLKNKIAIQCYERIKQLYQHDYSAIIANFYGIQFTHTLETNMNSNETIVPEPFLMLHLPIPLVHTQSPTLYDCIDAYLSDTTYIWNYPPILVIDLKRHKEGGKKNHQQIDIPLTLSLFHKQVGYNTKKNTEYSLHAVCYHSGTTGLGGHYTSDVLIHKQWYHFNDLQVTKITTPSLQKAYVIFYLHH